MTETKKLGDSHHLYPRLGKLLEAGFDGDKISGGDLREFASNLQSGHITREEVVDILGSPEAADALFAKVEQALEALHQAEDAIRQFRTLKRNRWEEADLVAMTSLQQTLSIFLVGRAPSTPQALLQAIRDFIAEHPSIQFKLADQMATNYGFGLPEPVVARYDFEKDKYAVVVYSFQGQQSIQLYRSLYLPFGTNGSWEHSKEGEIK